jgi:hypothetical protein
VPERVEYAVTASAKPVSLLEIAAAARLAFGVVVGDEHREVVLHEEGGFGLAEGAYLGVRVRGDGEAHVVKAVASGSPFA